MDPDARVQLAEIRGDVKLVLAGQSRTNDDVKDLRERVHLHSNRIQNLEAKDHQRAGAVATVKLLWAAGGFTAMGLLALAARHFSL